MKIKSDSDHSCPHCAVADAVNDWINSPGAATMVDANRTRSPEELYAYSDEQIAVIGLIRGLAVVAIDLIFAEPDGNVRADMIRHFSDAAAEQQIHQNLTREAGDTL